MATANGRRSYLEAGRTGVLAGTIACGVQTTVGWVLDQALLPRGQDNNIAPRFIHRSARRAGQKTNPVADWTLGTLFHLGYAVGWGAAFGVLRRWSGLPSLPLAGALGGLLYLLAFSRHGAGTETGTEPPPARRPWQKQLSLVSVAMTYALSLGLAFDRLDRRTDR